MEPADKELIKEKFKNVHLLIETSNKNVLDKLDQMCKSDKSRDTEFSKLKLKVERIDKATMVWQWFQAKPLRFALILGVIVVFSIPEARQTVFGWFKFL